MNKTIWTIAAVAAMGFAVAACAKDSKDMAADSKAAPAAEAAPAADANAAADTSAAPADTAAKPADTAAADQGSATVPEAAPAPADNGAAPEATAEAAPEPPPAPQTESQMLRDVRYGARAVRTCTRIEDVTVDTFMQCVNDQMSAAEAKGGKTDAFELGADYRAWAFMGEHATELRAKGLEWSKGYTKSFASRETYRQSAANLLERTGLSEKKVCDAVDVSDCPK